MYWHPFLTSFLLSTLLIKCREAKYFPSLVHWKGPGVGWPVRRKQKPAGVFCVCFAFLIEGTKETGAVLAPFPVWGGTCWLYLHHQ